MFARKGSMVINLAAFAWMPGVLSMSPIVPGQVTLENRNSVFENLENQNSGPDTRNLKLRTRKLNPLTRTTKSEIRDPNPYP